MSSDVVDAVVFGVVDAVIFCTVEVVMAAPVDAIETVVAESSISMYL